MENNSPINTNLMSETEIYFSDWCFYLQQLGFIETFTYETYTEFLSNIVEIEEIKQIEKKTKSKKEISTKTTTKTLFQPTSITADFTINWTDKGLDYFCKDLNTSIRPFKIEYKPSGLNYFISQNKISHIEIKPHYESKNINSSIEFPIKQKWLWNKMNVLIQKIKPIADLKKSIRYWYCLQQRYQLSQDNSTTKLKMTNSLFDLTFYPNSFFYTETGKLKHNKEFNVDLITILPTIEKWKKQKNLIL